MPDVHDQLFGDPPPVSGGEPAPQAAPAAEPAVTAEPAAAAAAPLEAPPVTAGAATPPPQAPDYLRVLTDQNRHYLQTIQGQAEQTRQLMDVVLKQQQPELTPQQREEKIRQAFFEFNKNPDAYIGAQVDTRVEAVKKELLKELEKYAPRNAALEANQVVGDQMQGLLYGANGAVVRPELNDRAFTDVMFSKRVTDQVYAQHYAGVDPAKVITDKAFYLESYHLTKQLMAAAPGAQATNQQSATDMQSQRAVIAGHGAAGAGGKAPNSGAPPADPGRAFVGEMLAQQSPQDTLAAMFNKKA